MTININAFIKQPTARSLDLSYDQHALAGYDLARALDWIWPWRVSHEHDAWSDNVRLYAPEGGNHKSRILKIRWMAMQLPELVFDFDCEATLAYLGRLDCKWDGSMSHADTIVRGFLPELAEKLEIEHDQILELLEDKRTLLRDD